MSRRSPALLFALLVLIAALSGIVSAQATEEPPKVVEAATQVLTEGTVEAFLEGTSRYSFSAELGEAFVFSLYSNEFDPYLEIFDSDDFTVASDDDSGPSTNSLLLFVAPENAEYTVLVRPFSEGATGTYSLSMVKTFKAVSPNEAATVEIDGVTPTVWSFTATSDAFTVEVGGESTFEAGLALFSASGLIVNQTESSFVTTLQLPKAMVTQGMEYYVVITPYAGQVGPLSLNVTPAQFVTLSEEPQPVEFAAEQYEDVVLMKIEQGTRYLLSVSADYPVSVSVSLDGFEYDTYASLSLSEAEGGSMLFRAGGTGELRVRVNNNSYYDEDGVTVFLSVRPIE